MAVILFPRLIYFSLSSNHSYSIPSTRFLRSIKVSSREGTESTIGGNTTAAVVWFKKDLRIDDHPGLVAASRYRTVIPLYVFDHRIISRFSDEILELLLFALRDLRKSLKKQGSNLMIRLGSVESIIPELAKEVKATAVFAEEEIDYDLQTMMDTLEESLGLVHFDESSPTILPWNAPIYDIKNLKKLPASYHDFKKLQAPLLSPLLPQQLPALQMDLTWGSLPTLDDLKKFMGGFSGKSKDKWTSIKSTPAEEILWKDQIAVPKNLMGDLGFSKLGENIRRIYNQKPKETKRPAKSTISTQQGHEMGGGTCIVLDTLASYLRYAEGSTLDDWQEEGTSFGTLFGSALNLGIISKRRVHSEAIKYEKERNSGFLSSVGYPAATVSAAADTVCSMEWYWLIASRSQLIDEAAYSIRIWQWNGYIIQYAVAGHQGPAIVLVHGFGAFLEHYRDNINAIAETGNRVWAITLLGFGKSEKPNVVYTELMWAELLRDFIIEVVEEPAYLVGNSIGGYLVSIVAGLWPALAKSVVLLNGAGIVAPGYSSLPSSEVLLKVLSPRLTSGFAWLGARVLLFYLRLGVWNIVKKCYPNKPDRADDWLINEMLRAECLMKYLSYDPGAEIVLQNIFSFNLSIPLDYLLKGCEGKVLVIQGMKDPLSNSKSKLAMLREHCRGIVIRELDAGHCPHDELPEEVNSIIQEWVATIEGQCFLYKDS